MNIAIQNRITGVQNQKLTNMNKDLLARFDPGIIGGDLINTSYIGILIARSFDPSISASPQLNQTMTGIGIMTAVFNLWTSYISLKQAIESSKNPANHTQTMRLYADATYLFALGIMMLYSETVNPIPETLLTTLFFISALPVIYEISEKLKIIGQGKDIGSQLEFKTLEDRIERAAWNELPESIQEKLRLLNTDQGMVQLYNQLQADVGIEAAIPTFKLLCALHQKDQKQALASLPDAQTKIRDYNSVLQLRMAQQLLYFVGFVASIQTIPGLDHPTQELVQYAILFAANFTAIPIDIFEPLKRTTPIVPTPYSLTEPNPNGLYKFEDAKYSSDVPDSLIFPPF